jgi:type 1 glutamine amidotransferase
MKILLLSNSMPHYHRIENTLPALQKALDGMTLEHSQDVADLNADKLQGHDAVLVYCTGQKLDDAPCEALEQFVSNGGALIGIHNATDTWKNQPGYINLIGGAFVTHPPQLSLQIEIVDTDHPITRGLAPFETWEELYVMDTDPATYHLLSQTRSYEDRALPIAWCKEHGAGRVFYTALGHEPVERADGGPFNANFQTLLRRGALWVMKQL